MAFDFLAVGDVTTDTFIRLKDAAVHCDINNEQCTISMPWGAKIPYEFAVDVSGVGNAANAAVSAARLGLKTGFLSHAGTDQNGETSIATLQKNGVDTSLVMRTEGASNHDFVLWYEDERTILVKHESSAYALPESLEPPRFLYLSSVGDASGTFHTAMAEWLKSHPDVTFAFQPGRELAQGLEVYKSLYTRANLCTVNKQEAEGLLGIGSTAIQELLQKFHAAGPRIVLITDGPNGAYAFDGEKILRVPMYPDPKAPLDRTGAGDAFASTVAAALALGTPLEEALLWGPVNSMSVVQKIGAQEGLLRRSELETFLKTAPANYRIETL